MKPETPSLDCVPLLNDISEIAVSDAAKRPSQLSKAAEAAKEARTVLMEALEGINEAVNHFGPKQIQLIRTIREFKMSAVAEIASIKNGIKDVSESLSGDRAEKALQNMERFIVLAERVRSLAKDGTLSALEEFLIKMTLNEGVKSISEDQIKSS